MRKSALIIASISSFAIVLCSFKILTRNSCGSSAIDPKHPNIILSQNGIDGASGSPKDIINWGGTGYCADCHGTSSGVTIAITSTPALTSGYTPGQTYNMSVSVSKASILGFGFNFEAQTTSNTNAGSFAVTAAGTKTFNTLSTLNMSHSSPASGSGSYTFNFNWIAPASATTGLVTFYASGVAANMNGSDLGDFTAKTSMTIAPSPASGINEVVNNDNISIYPVPTNEKFTIQLNQPVDANTNVKMISVDGKEVYDLKYYSNQNIIYVEIPATSAKGIYFVKVISNNKILTEKLIVQ